MSGTPPSKAAIVVIMIGRNRSSAALRIDCSGDRCSSRSAAIAKSTIMMPFFLTMPISRMMPIRARPQQRRLADRLLGRQVLVALRGDREVDHHDAVLLDDADQQDDADQGETAAAPPCGSIARATGARRAPRRSRSRPS